MQLIIHILGGEIVATLRDLFSVAPKLALTVIKTK